MPGYDKGRFVDVTLDELDEFTCGICMDVFNEPVVSPCCRQTYCKDCINLWLTSNNSCPNDRIDLSADQLAEPPRALINLINMMHIKCDFHLNGCRQCVRFEELSAHRKGCAYNPNGFCMDCGISIDFGHNCIENLKIKNDSINDEIRRLIEENEILKRENFLLNTDQTVSPINFIYKSEMAKVCHEKGGFGENCYHIKCLSIDLMLKVAFEESRVHNLMTLYPRLYNPFSLLCYKLFSTHSTPN